MQIVVAQLVILGMLSLLLLTLSVRWLVARRTGPGITVLVAGLAVAGAAIALWAAAATVYGA